jgi:hypothetical protein
MRELFVPYNPQAKTLVVIGRANAIIAEHAEQAQKLTLRQLYYQFVARGLVDENTLAQYKRLGRIICDARDGGLIDWDAIEDRTREAPASAKPHCRTVDPACVLFIDVEVGDLAVQDLPLDSIRIDDWTTADEFIRG